MKIFVGNLLFDATETDVRKVFEGLGSVASVAIVMDKNGKKSRGFGFVEMSDEEQAQAAIAALDGQEFMGRPLDVSLAHPKPEKSQDIELREKMRAKISQENAGFNPSLHRTGRYKRGKRSISFIKRRLAAGVKEPMLARKYKDNPMRWRKKTGGNGAHPG